jgi:hypothetical protein
MNVSVKSLSKNRDRFFSPFRHCDFARELKNLRARRAGIKYLAKAGRRKGKGLRNRGNRSATKLIDQREIIGRVGYARPEDNIFSIEV